MYITDTVKSDYDGSKFIHFIHNFYIGGTCFQLIWVKNSEPQEVIGRFCCNLSEAIWDCENNTGLYSPAYLEGRRRKEVHLVTGGDGRVRQCSDAYAEKMKQKFPDYTFIDRRK